MSKRSLTREERFLMAIHEAVNGEIDLFIDPKPLAKNHGVSERQLATVLQLLKQINCIKQSRASGEVALIERGLVVCENLKA